MATPARFTVEDDLHAEIIGTYGSEAEALAMLQRLAATPWDVPPNRAPCSGWRDCGRHYEIVAYAEAGDGAPWREVSRRLVLTVGAGQSAWQGPPPG